MNQRINLWNYEEKFWSLRFYLCSKPINQSLFKFTSSSKWKQPESNCFVYKLCKTLSFFACSPWCQELRSLQIECIAAWKTYLIRKFLVGISPGSLIIAMRSLHSVVNVSCRNPSAILQEPSKSALSTCNWRRDVGTFLQLHYTEYKLHLSQHSTSAFYPMFVVHCAQQATQGRTI